MSIRIIKWSFLLLFFPLLNLTWAKEKTSDFSVLSSSEESCVIAFSPSHFQIDTLVITGKHYQVINFSMASYPEHTGEPMIPSRILVVGIPPSGGVKVSVVGSDFIEKQGIRLLPIPLLEKKDNLPWETYKEGPLYQKSGFTPGILYKTEEPAYFGDQRIVRIHLYPVQYNPGENRIHYYTRIVLRVEFMGKSEIPYATKQKLNNERLYQEAVINYSVAKKWRRRINKQVRKKGGILGIGKYYKIPVSKEGLFKVSGSFLKKHGIDISSIDPATLKIYNNGGKELPRNINTPRPDSLIENPILVFGIDDGRFDESDYFLFYGKEVNGWEYNSANKTYNHYINHYTDKNIYWLVFNDGKPGQRIKTAPSSSAQGAEDIDSFVDRFFLEQEIYNPLEGGILWLGYLFTDQTPSKSYKLSFTNPVPDTTVRFRFRFAATTAGTHRFDISLNNQVFKQISFPGPFAGIKFSSQTVLLSAVNLPDQSTLSFQYTGSGPAPNAYLDWFEVEYRRYLKASNGKLTFFSPETEGVYNYQLSGFNTEPFVLNVTDFSRIQRMELKSISGGWAFVDSVGSLPKKYIAVQSSAFLSPETITEDTFPSLRSPSNGGNLIIITHPDFYDQALRLKELHEKQDSLSVVIVNIQDIYDEFSWGLYDPVAIRDFVKAAYDNWNPRPSYLLLFGDGDYDYKNIISNNDKNWIPPFEYSGLTESSSRASDDWFTYVSGNDYFMDLAVGRLPVQSVEEARTVVDKIIQYETDPLWGDWKSLVTIVGDDEKTKTGDENETTHIIASEYIAEHCIPHLFNLNKIYLTEYPEVITTFRQKPQARDDLIDQINRGTLLVNYVGHGNEEVWAHERIFQKDIDLPALHNGAKLPLFYAATCSFARYDNPNKQSFSEALLNTEEKGAIAVIGASRFCSASSNEALDKTFLIKLFENQNLTLRLGDAMRLAKLNTGIRENNEMYHILGDPAMRLGAPRYRAIFTKIEPDTFKALGIIKIEGTVEKNGIPWNDFTGQFSLKGFDSKKKVVYTTQHGTRVTYSLPGNTIFRGRTKVENGRFKFSFIVPKDISYGGNTARLSCYFWNNETDGAGYQDGIEERGSINLVDREGPEIELYFQGQENFTTGEMVPEEPELVAVIQDDKTGVNITGEIGHKIELTIDENENRDLTDYFQYDEGSYLEGKLTYRLDSIKSGKHTLSLKAWDNANNSSTQSIEFNVVPMGELRIERVLNYPNPFSASTHFTFQLNQDAKVEIKIFTVDGRLVKRFEGIMGGPGFNMFPPGPNEGWDGRDEMGDLLANGIYLYKIIAKAYVNGKDLKKEVVGRLVIMR